MLDGLSVEDWLGSRDPRPTRKACLLNLMAKLRTVPTPETPLIAEVDNVFFAATDRIYGRVNAGLFSQLQALADDDEQPFYYEGSPTSATHKKLLARIEERGWGRANDYTLHSFRQERQTCMQAVVAVPSRAAQLSYADFDIDLGNPLQDVRGFVVHMGELIGGGTTDHLKLRDKLAKGTMKAFMYYDVD